MLMFGWDFEFWNLIKICVRTCYFGKQNSTLGSVVPLAMLFILTWFIHPMIFKDHVSKQFWFFSSLRSNSALIIFLVHSLHTCISIPTQGNILCLIMFWRFFSDLVMSFNNPLDIKTLFEIVSFCRRVVQTNNRRHEMLPSRTGHSRLPLVNTPHVAEQRKGQWFQ